MTTLIIAIFVIMFFTLFDAMSDAWMFRDFRNNMTRGENWIANLATTTDNVPTLEKAVNKAILATASPNAKWHRWQFFRQALVIAFAAWYAQEWPLLVLGAGVFWLFHDGLVNMVGLRRGFFFVGTTAAIDRFFQRLPYPEVMMATAKIILFAGGIYLTYAF